MEAKQIILSVEQTIVGYKFRPDEEELINYLKAEKPGFKAGFCIIPTVEHIYRIDPWKLKAEFREKSIIPSSDREWWFISSQTQGQHACRKTPCGYSWKITGARTAIKAKVDGTSIGSKRILTYPDSRGSKGSKCSWVIHEYCLNPSDLNGRNVLCHLMRKQDETADDSTFRSEDGAADLEKLNNFVDQVDEEGSIPEYSIQERMDSLPETPQHQNQVFPLHVLQLLLQWALHAIPR